MGVSVSYFRWHQWHNSAVLDFPTSDWSASLVSHTVSINSFGILLNWVDSLWHLSRYKKKEDSDNCYQGINIIYPLLFLFYVFETTILIGVSCVYDLKERQYSWWALFSISISKDKNKYFDIQNQGNTLRFQVIFGRALWLLLYI